MVQYVSQWVIIFGIGMLLLSLLSLSLVSMWLQRAAGRVSHGTVGLRFSSTVEHLSPREDGWSFLIVGDWGCGLLAPASSCLGSSAGQRAVAVAMAADAEAEAVDFVVNTGDSMYTFGLEGELAQDAKFHDTFTSVYTEESLQQRKWYGVLGNHDWKMNAAALVTSQGNWHIPATSYVVKSYVGGVPLNIFFIDTNAINKQEICYERNRSAWARPPWKPLTVEDTMQCQEEIQRIFDEQLEWLRGVLVEARGWKIVVAHEPTYMSSRYSCTVSKNYETDCNYLHDRLSQLYADTGVHALINGHDHLLRHDLANGIHQFTVGYGGSARAGDASLGYWDSNPSIAVHPSNFVAFANDSFWGYARAKVNATCLSLDFMLTTEENPVPVRAYSYQLPLNTGVLPSNPWSLGGRRR